MHCGIIHPVLFTAYTVFSVSHFWQVAVPWISIESQLYKEAFPRLPQGRKHGIFLIFQRAAQTKGQINWKQHLSFSELLIEKALKEFDGTATWFTTLWAFLSAFHVFHPCRAASHLLLLLGLTSTRSLFRPLTRQDIHIWSATHFSQLLFCQHVSGPDGLLRIRCIEWPGQAILEHEPACAFHWRKRNCEISSFAEECMQRTCNYFFPNTPFMLPYWPVPIIQPSWFQVTMQNTLESYPSDASVILNINYSSRTSQSLWIHLDNVP